jgi:two-component system, OmpR family, osmolarity sensor histidine kinase EnvZ
MWTNFHRRLWLNWLRFWKRTSPQTLLGRSMLILVTPVVLTLGIGIFVFFDRHWSTTTNRLTTSLAGEVAVISESWESETLPDKRLLLAKLYREKLGLKVHFSANEQLPKTHKIKIPGINHALERALDEKLVRDFSIKYNNSESIVINVSLTGGVLKIDVPQKYLFSTTTYVFLLFIIGSGLMLSLIAVIFMRNQIRPVRKLAIVAEQFGKGIDVPRFRPSGAKEVRQASRAFLDMRDRIQRQMRQRTDMLSGVSHDLRTPLTRMKLQLAMLPPTSDTDALQNDILAMEKMIKGYLDFAKDETSEHSVQSDIIQILTHCISDAQRQGFTVYQTVSDEPVFMAVRPQSIARVFTNLLENARLYAKAAWVSTHLLTRSLEIIIDDNGPGIPEESREDVFKPFHRIDLSRNQNIEGTGLGLTIARDMVQSHGGTITLETSPHGGLRVIIWLPL